MLPTALVCLLVCAVLHLLVVQAPVYSGTHAGGSASGRGARLDLCSCANTARLGGAKTATKTPLYARGVSSRSREQRDTIGVERAGSV